MSDAASLYLTPEVMVTPKAYWVDQRLNGYGRWALPFWRELFQNSVDAKATRIDITIEEATPRGAFGEEASVSEIIRVRFADNGTGMSEDIIRNVFFRPGASGKRDIAEQIGGFGTARIMLCWSQVRYSIQTNSLYVEGDGSRYTCRKIPDEIAAREAMIRSLEQSGAEDRIAQIRGDIEMLRAMNPRQSGCEFVIDINPKETPDRYRNVDQEKLREALSDYLSLSQLPCKVYLNGEQLTEQCKKGQVKRLLAVEIENRTIDFAKIHLSDSKKARYSGNIIVRVNGAFMFKKYADCPQQVIVELEPKLAREILNETRNGLVEPYSSALDALQNALAVDRQSALKAAEERKHEIVRGSFGGMALMPPSTNLLAALTEGGHANDDSDDEAGVSKAERSGKDDETPTNSIKYVEMEDRINSDKREAGLVEVMRRMFSEISREPQIFLENLPHFLREEGRLFVGALKLKGEACLEQASPSLAVWLHREVARREVALLGEGATGIIQMHDLHIHKENIPKNDPQMYRALRTHHPSYWRSGTKVFGGNKPPRWSAPHMLFTVWSACVRYVLDVLRTQHSGSGEGDRVLKFATGWYFGPKEEVWDNRKNQYVPSRTLALHKKLEDGTHVYLLNPILENGSPAYDLSLTEESADYDEVGGLARLIALAKHEVAHTITDSHNEDYARTLSKLDMAMSELRHVKGIYAAAHAAVESVKATYGKGRVTVALFDTQDKNTLPTAIPGPASEHVATKARRPRKVRATAMESVENIEAFDDETPKAVDDKVLTATPVSDLDTPELDHSSTCDVPCSEDVTQPLPDEEMSQGDLTSALAAPSQKPDTSATDLTGLSDIQIDLEIGLSASPEGVRQEEGSRDESDVFLASLDAAFDEPSMIEASAPLSSWDDIEATITTLAAADDQEHAELAVLAGLVDVSLDDLYNIQGSMSEAVVEDPSPTPISSIGASSQVLATLLGEEFNLEDLLDVPATNANHEQVEQGDLNDPSPGWPEEEPLELRDIPDNPDLDDLFKDPSPQPGMRM